MRLSSCCPNRADTYIASNSETAFYLALKGSVGGTACALATLIGIVQLTGDLDASLLPHATLAYWHWPVLALLPAPGVWRYVHCPVDHPARPAAHGLNGMTRRSQRT